MSPVATALAEQAQRTNIYSHQLSLSELDSNMPTVSTRAYRYRGEIESTSKWPIAMHVRKRGKDIEACLRPC